MFKTSKRDLVGSKYVSRNDFIFGRVDKNTSANISLKELTESKKIPTLKYSITVGNEVLDLTSVYSKAEGKMDVKYSTEYRTFKSSEKFWQNPNRINDFGSTYLFHGLTRAASADKALSYGLVISYYGSKQRLYKTEKKDYTSNTFKLHQFA